MKKRKGLTAFEQVFLGERVHILTKLKSTQVQTNEDGSGQSFEAYTEFEVFILDVDRHFIYYGETPDQISGAFRKTVIARIMIVNEETMIRDLMEGAESPSKEMN